MFFPPIRELATTDVVSVAEGAHLNEALQLMARNKVRDLVIRKESGGYGLLTAPDLVRMHFSLPSFDIPIAEASCRPLPTLSKESNILDVLDDLDGSQGYAAVVDADGELYGIVSNTDILSSLDPQVLIQRQYLRDLFHRHEVKKMPSRARVEDVLALMADADDAVIVDDHGKAVGIVTTQDAVTLLQNEAILTDPVHLHMSAPLHTVTDDLTVGQAVADLRENRFKRLVVEDAETGEVIGIVTQKDLIGVAYSRWADLIRRHVLKLSEIIQVLERKSAHLEQIAATDPLTGAANRARFEELFRLEAQRHARSPETPFSAILVDIDDFKAINDTWGHNQGDVVLKEVVQLLQGHLRHIDTLARWGGEEFAILLPQTDLSEARLVAKKLCNGLAHHRFPTVGSVTASFGVATVQTDESCATMLGRADSALYRAKHMGRNRVE